MMAINKKQVKKLLGKLPQAAELYWQVRQPGKPLTKSFSLHRIEKALPEWCDQIEIASQQNKWSSTNPKNIFIFATLRQWIQQGTLLGMAMAGLGHNVTLAYTPYADWRNPISTFDLRRQNLYAKGVLEKAEPWLRPVNFLNFVLSSTKNQLELPPQLLREIKNISIRDVQYTLQIEDFDAKDKDSQAGRLYELRLQRNEQAAYAALIWFETNKPDIALIGNGSILELGAVYQVTRYLGIPVVTFEFGEQHQRIWLAQNTEVMQQNTDSLWEQQKKQPLNEKQWEKIKSLYSSRRQANLWENFSRRWQGAPNQGGVQVKTDLRLDTRPIILLAANVIGDSLTLGRQIFSSNMTDWLKDTIHYYSTHDEFQLVIRVHPGEKYTKGPSVADIVRDTVSPIPDHIHLISAEATINTYDLIDIATLGLVYTTTVGMEMAMSGLPVVVSGKTHYRGKGFTFDPTTWQDYYLYLDQLLANSSDAKPSKEQVDSAWNYAYRFYFEYPCLFPWHLHFFALHELDEWPLERVLSDEGQMVFGNTFQYLTGTARDWSHPDTLSVS